MKKFLSGFLSCALIMGLSLSALAISGRMTIEVDPINIQVNGQTFAPTDVTGKEVPVFAYQGTTYAPLRALAEAYGLEVGYDAAANMATVADPEAKPADTQAPDTTAKTDYSDWSAEDEAAYQEFKEKWELTFSNIVELPYDGLVWVYAIDTSDEHAAAIAVQDEGKGKFKLRLLDEISADVPTGNVVRVTMNGVPAYSIIEFEKGGEILFCSVK